MTNESGPFRIQKISPLTRKERERLVRRQEIIRVAKRIFAEKGFDGATLEEIALKAEFAKGTLYGYFKNKEDLYISLLEEELGHLFGIMEGAMKEEENPLEKVKTLINRIFSYLVENREFFQIFTPERTWLLKGECAEMKKRIHPKFEKVVEATAECLEEVMRTGRMRKLDSKIAANALLGMVRSSAMRWMMEGQKGSLEREAEVITGIFLYGIQRCNS